MNASCMENVVVLSFERQSTAALNKLQLVPCTY